MDTATTSRPKTYRTPTHYIDVEARVSLDVFSDEEIVEYVKQNGLLGSIADHLGDLSTIDTLLMCGQREAALEIISKSLTIALERPVRL